MQVLGLVTEREWKGAAISGEKEGEVILQMFMTVSKSFIIMLFEYTSGGQWFNFG